MKRSISLLAVAVATLAVAIGGPSSVAGADRNVDWAGANGNVDWAAGQVVTLLH